MYYYDIFLNTSVVMVLCTPVGGKGVRMDPNSENTFFDQTQYISRLLLNIHFSDRKTEK